jgi:hypothetical protein
MLLAQAVCLARIERLRIAHLPQAGDQLAGKDPRAAECQITFDGKSHHQQRHQEDGDHQHSAANQQREEAHPFDLCGGRHMRLLARLRHLLSGKLSGVGSDGAGSGKIFRIVLRTGMLCRKDCGGQKEQHEKHDERDTELIGVHGETADPGWSPERSPGDRRRALAIGAVMGGVLIGVVAVQPALGSTAAGLAGLAACWWLLPGRGRARPAGADLGVAALPYVVLTATAAVGFAFPPVRTVLEAVPELAPVLPGSDAAFGFSTPDAATTPVFRPLLHPLPYVLLAVVTAVVAYRARGWWAPRLGRQALASWGRRSRTVASSILGLTVLAALLTEAGMISALADALAGLLGGAFVVVSAPLGAFGTMLTGSTTASNAMGVGRVR